ncbi:lamin-A-like [Acanthopagrus schlegelii]
MLRQKFQEKLQKKITELQEEQNRRDKAEKDVLKKDLQDKTDQRESKKLDSSSLSQNSTRRLKVVVKIDPEGKYFQLKNTSAQEQQLGGWSLKIQVNNNKNVIHKFEDSFILKAYHHFTVSSSCSPGVGGPAALEP